MSEKRKQQNREAMRKKRLDPEYRENQAAKERERRKRAKSAVTCPPIESPFERLLNREYEVERIAGFRANELTKIYKMVENDIVRTTTRGEERKQHVPATFQTPDFHQFLLTMVFLQSYPTMAVMEFMFDINRLLIGKYLSRCLAGMRRAFDEQQVIRWPTFDEFVEESRIWRPHLHPNMTGVACVVDGTEFKIEEPVDKERKKTSYSGKKKQFSVNLILITKLNGEIIYASEPYTPPHDQKQWKELNLRERFVRKPYGIIGDSGFFFNPSYVAYSINGFTPYRSSKKHPLDEEQKAFNKKLHSLRSVIENTNAVLKSFRIFKQTYRHHHPDGQGPVPFSIVIPVVASLANLKIKASPLRTP